MKRLMPVALVTAMLVMTLSPLTLDVKAAELQINHTEEEIALYDAEESVFSFNNDTIVASHVSDDAYEIDETTLTIKSAGSYVLTGTCRGGNVYIEPDIGSVTLTLRSLYLSAGDTAPIMIDTDNNVTIRLEGANTLADYEDPETVSDTYVGAAIYAAGSYLTITGSGEASINSTCEGIEADTINLNGGFVSISSIYDGILAEEAININGGTWTVNASSSDALVSLGSIKCTGGYVEAFASSDAGDSAYSFGSDSTFAITGGSGFGLSIDPVSYPTSGLYLVYGKSSSTSSDIKVYAGDIIAINDNAGHRLGSTRALREADNIIFYNDELITGENYTLTVNNVDIATLTPSGSGDESDKKPVYTAPTPLSNTYSGLSQPLISAGRVTGGRFYYALGDNGATEPTSGWSETVPTRIEVGTYYVWYRIYGSEGYSDISPKYVGSPSTIEQSTSHNVISIDEDGHSAVVYDDVAGTNKTVDINIISQSIIYRMYDPHRGEHFYTKDTSEMRYLVRLGWNHEQDSDFTAASALEGDAIPVYRLYNPNNGGMHFYTTDSIEGVRLRTIGWKYEGISHYVYKPQSSLGEAQYRLYNPNSRNGEHNWTSDETEYMRLKTIGWRDEGLCWRVL